jgi:hypothetical protein
MMPLALDIGHFCYSISDAIGNQPHYTVEEGRASRPDPSRGSRGDSRCVTFEMTEDCGIVADILGNSLP